MIDMDDITYCASTCGVINCIRNRINIKNHNVLHSWCRPEDIPDCPLKKMNKCGTCKCFTKNCKDYNGLDGCIYHMCETSENDIACELYEPINKED